MNNAINAKKIVFGGDSSVGKTSIIKKYCENTFINEGTTPTVNVNFSTKDITVDDKDVKLQFWDTAGQEAYRSISASYFRNAKGVVLVFDLTNTESFFNLNEWIKMVKEKAGDIPWIVFGNKSDLVDNIKIQDNEVQEFSENHNVPCFTGSAKEGTGIEEAFYQLTVMMLEAEAQKPEVQETALPQPKKDGKKCC